MLGVVLTALLLQVGVYDTLSVSCELDVLEPLRVRDPYRNLGVGRIWRAS